MAKITGKGFYLPRDISGSYSAETAEKFTAEADLAIKSINAPNDLMKLIGDCLTSIRSAHGIPKDTESLEGKGFIGAAENMGASAATRAIIDAGLSPGNIDYIVACSTSPTYDIPNLGCTIGHLIQANGVGGAAFNTLGSGFVHALIDGYCRIKSGKYRNVLVVVTEALDEVSLGNRILFGNCAAAYVLSAEDQEASIEAPETARIIGTGSYIPGVPLNNIELMSRVRNFRIDYARKSLSKQMDVQQLTDADVFDLWVKQVTGIHTRHIAEESPEYMGAMAARRAMGTAELFSIDFIIGTSFTGSDNPNLGKGISDQLFLNVPGITLNTACCGFIDGLIDAYCRIKSGLYKNVMVVAAEQLSSRINWDDPSTAILFADGAGAALVQAADTGVMGLSTGSDYSVDNILCKKGGHIEMGGGPNVLRRAVYAITDAARKAVEDCNAGLGILDVNFIVPHQANYRIIDGHARQLRYPMERVCLTIHRFGNTSGASEAIALDYGLNGMINCSIKPGDIVMIDGVGGGYTKAGIVLRI